MQISNYLEQFQIRKQSNYFINENQSVINNTIKTN